MAVDRDFVSCEDEPIHIPGAVQPHGALLLCRASDLHVLEVSANVAAVLGVEPRDVLGQPVDALFEAAAGARLAKAAVVPDLRAVNPLRLESKDGRALDGVLHRPPAPTDSLVLEIEPTDPDAASDGTGFDFRLRDALLSLQRASDRDALAQQAARQLRALTGFDRVMIYRFDRDWNGQVVAEAREDRLDSFLHQRYPASDIPAQARRLYELNWLRLISDVSYTPAPMLGREGAPPLDMSFATLRSVSPIHIEYLKNMGVTASMSISLLVDGRLAGLIACHHYSGPRRVSFVVRETCEYLGHALSWHGAALRGAHAATMARRVQDKENDVMVSVARESDLLTGLATSALPEMVAAQGAAVLVQEGSRRIGTTPTTEQLAVLVDFLDARGADTFVSDKLADELPAAADWTEFASGILAVTISRELKEYIVWFRPMTERTIDWAGNPHHEKLTGGNGEAHRLTPRGSFEVWREVVRGRSLPWEPWEIEGASNLRRLLLGGIRRRAAELHALNGRLLEADRAKNDFIATVSHELRTPLNAIAGWTHMLERGHVPGERMQQAISVISRNVETQRQLVEDLLDTSRMASGKLTLDVSNVDLPLIVETAIHSVSLSAVAKDIQIRTVLDDTQTSILGDALRLKQIVTNLLTNAIKFTPKGGRVHVSLQRVGSEVELCVSDNGIGIQPDFLPHVFDLFRQEDAKMNRRSQGLGLGLSIVKKLTELHGGRVTAESDGESRGSTFRVRLPVQAARPIAEPILEGAPAFGGTETVLQGLHVLVVEDERDSRDLVQHIIESAGAKVTSVADANEALEVLAAGVVQFDLVLSDIGLPVIDGIQFMKMVRDKSAGGDLPSVALTAHTRAVDRTRVLQAGFHAHVPKPVDPEELVAVVASVARRKGTSASEKK